MSSNSSEARELVLDVPSPDDEVEVLLSPKQHRNSINRGWVAPSELSLNTLETMETKVANELSDFRKADDDSQKTWSRRFVEKVLMKMSWYYPNKRDESAPRLEDGWAFYEHVTLARYFQRDSKSDPVERAEPGEKIKRTDLYSLFMKGFSMNDFGIGVALYFNTMIVMAFALLVAGVLSLPNMIYYASDEYNGEQLGFSQNTDSSRLFTVPFSANCENFIWAECESEYCQIDRLVENNIEYLTNNGNTITLVKKNNCDGGDGPTFQQGMINFGALVMVMLITVLFNIYQSKKQVVYDEDKVTASDYSIIVKNPPTDAYDPDEWEAFFSKYDSKGIAVVTVLLNNAPLLKQIMFRRTLRKNLHNWFPKTNLDSKEELEDKLASHQWQPGGCAAKFVQCVIRPIVKPFNMLLHPDEIVQKLKDVENEITELKKVKYEVSDVIVTFETEDGQRLAMETLCTGRINVRYNRIASKKPEELFRGNHVLDCAEPEEPSAMRYLDIDANPFKCFIQQMCTLAFTIGLVALGGVLVFNTRKSRGPFWAGILVTSMNVLIPNFAKILVIFEQHASEDERQKSMYIKIALFRWINTAVIAKLTTPLSQTLGSAKENLIPAMNGIFISEMFLPPVLNIIDIMGNINKHFFAPRARTMHQMLLCFKGTPYNLAEKYTDVSKIIFVAYFYAAINPPLLFMGAIALVIRYCADKYCIMRIWSSAPYIGPKLSSFSRRYFLSFAVIIGALVSAYDWAQFPFDRICESQEKSPLFNVTTPIETFFFRNEDGFIVAYEKPLVIASDKARVCNTKECCQEIGTRFPPVPSVFETKEFYWMTEDQERLSKIFGWTSVGLLIAFAVVVFGGNILKLIMSLFKGVYKPTGQDQKIDFSSIKDIDGYIPQVRIGSYAYPLLACDIDDIDQTLIGWNDPGTSYDEYNMVFDVDHGSRKRKSKIVGSTRYCGKLRSHMDYQRSDTHDENENPIFSIVKQWDLTDRRGALSLAF